jgi:hypothetical protein
MQTKLSNMNIIIPENNDSNTILVTDLDETMGLILVLCNNTLIGQIVYDGHEEEWGFMRRTIDAVEIERTEHSLIKLCKNITCNYDNINFKFLKFDEPYESQN